MTKCNHCQVYSIKDYGTCANCGAPLVPFGGRAKKIIAEWSGSYPSLCYGHWSILVDGISLPIPKDKIGEPMGTFKTYEEWHFENWSEVFTSYEDGMDETEWIDVNKSWIDAGLKEINKTFSFYDYCDLYDAIRKEDFRRGSCGGCI